MQEKYKRANYDDNLGYKIIHVDGMHAGESTLSYLHYSMNFLFMYFKSGEGNIKIEGRNYRIEEGDIIILKPTELFQFTVNDSIYHERISLNVNESLLNYFPYDFNALFEPFYEREKGIGNKISAKTVHEYGLDKYFDEIMKYVRLSDSTSAVLGFCKVVELLAELNKIVTPNEFKESSQIFLNPLIGKILNYLNMNFKEDITLADVAERFNIDKSYLSHLFKEHVGMSLWTYVIFRRIKTFNYLLITNNSIEDTCYQAGFQNYSNFFRLYKKYMKMTPTEYKKQIKIREKRNSKNKKII